MREMQSMHPAEKDQFCEYIYEDFIVKTALVLCQYEKYAKVVNLYIPISCYTNFRDSLFHFRKMVSSIEEREIEEQSFAIKEHFQFVFSPNVFDFSSRIYRYSKYSSIILTFI